MKAKAGLPAKELVLDRAGGALLSCKALAARRGSCHLKGKALSILLSKPKRPLLKTKAAKEQEKGCANLT